jgi:hypothetical protein
VPLPLPDPNYHLDAAARLRLKPGVDAEALERLLQYFPAESRASHLALFSSQQDVVAGSGRSADITILDRISHPVLQRLLEEVWQPYWATIPDAEFDTTNGPPGRELARVRRKQKPQR